ncbi:NUDIX domain-containing protein [Paenibacillus sp. S150]|uniref:NUDIX hydrolase n=1 Tax=Paenibacillus sp. S150 TaxID=2749826 RepID=UPI002815FD39|nr:NUDIX domain-containing protein [Paenibacillus sp. S150]
MAEFRVLSVVHTVLIKDQEIVLLRRCNTGHDDGCYGLPAGRLDGGEQLHEAAAREVYEECGITVQHQDLKRLGVMHIKTNDGGRIDFFFTAERWSGELLNAEPDKCDDIGWFSLDKLPEKLIPFVKQAVGKLRDDFWFSSHGW